MSELNGRTPTWVETTLESESLIMQSPLGHSNKAGFHSKCNAKPLKYFFFLVSGLIFNKLCLAAGTGASVERGRPVDEAFAVI